MEKRTEGVDQLYIENSAPLDIEKSEDITRNDIDRELDRVELENRGEELEGKRQDRKQRGKFSIWIFVFMGAYMLSVVVVLILSGAEVLHLSDGVLISMMTTTTADVIGVFIVVAKYLFHN